MNTKTKTFGISLASILISGCALNNFSGSINETRQELRGCAMDALDPIDSVICSLSSKDPLQQMSYITNMVDKILIELGAIGVEISDTDIDFQDLADTILHLHLSWTKHGAKKEEYKFVNYSTRILIKEYLLEKSMNFTEYPDKIEI